MTTTIGMWEMVSELLEGEKLPVSMNEAIEGLCNGNLVIAERHEFSKLEADVYVLKAQVEYLRKPLEITDEEIMDELVKVKHTWVATTSVWFEFEKEELKKAIKAILRKAQEK